MELRLVGEDHNGVAAENSGADSGTSSSGTSSPTQGLEHIWPDIGLKAEEQKLD